MPPAVIAVAAAIGTALAPFAAAAITGAALTAISTIVVSALITVAIAVAAQVAISLGRKPTNQRTNQGEELRLKLDPGMARQLILGRAATGDSVVWSFTYGSTADVPNNAYLVRVIALCDLPCNALVGIYEGKQLLTFAGDVTASLQACNQHKSDTGATHMWCRVHLGSPTPTADADVMSWSGGQWTANHKGVNMCYAVLRYLYDGEGNAFPNGEPQLIFVLDGVKEYDQRLDSSRGVGHSGSQRLSDPTTWAFSRNAAVITQQVLRGFYSNNVLLIGAQAADRELDDAMLVSAYNTSDESVAYSGGTQPRYRAGYVVSSTMAVADILVQLQAAMDGKVLDRGGNITIRPGATHTPVFNLTDDDLVWDAEKSWQPRLNLSEIYNFVDGVFVDEATIFNEKPFPPLRSATYEAQDGGQRLEMQLGYSAVTDWAQVQRMTKRIHLQSRLQGTIAFFLPLWGLEMEQDDWFTLTSTRFSFTNKYFVALNVDLVMNPGLMVGVIAREVSSTIDGWNPAVDEKARSDTTWTGQTGISDLPVPTLTPTAVTKTSTAEVVEQYGVSIVVTNLGTQRGVAETLEIQIAPQADHSNPSLLGEFPSRDQTIEYYGLLAGTAYSIRGRAVSTGKVGTYSAWSDFTTGSSNLGYTVTALLTTVFSANSDGTMNPSTQLPKTIVTDVQKDVTSIKTSNSVSYSISTTGCTASVDNTNGSGTKGDITVTAFPGWSAFIDLTVVANGVQLPVVRITLTKSTSATGGGGGSSGGSGAKTVTDSTLNVISGASFIAMTDTMTLTLASGESLYGTGALEYDASTELSGSFVMEAKWQYAVAGSGTWVDFPGSPITGSSADGNGGPGLGGEPPEPPWPGFISMVQTKGGLSAGNYDVRIVARKASGGATSAGPYGTAKCEAKV